MTFNKKLNASILGLAIIGSLVSCSSTKEVLPKTAQAVEPTSEVSDQVVTVASDEDYNRSPAAECNSSKYTDCKDARKNDTAERYYLGIDGTLYRKINKAICAVTTKVQDFKISQHPNDIAVVYYRKNGDLYLINLDKELRAKGNCPSAKSNTKLLMSKVSKYTVTASINSTIVNAALDVNGNFFAWDDRNVVYKDSRVSEFQMNDCYGVKNKSFSSYVLFTKDVFNSVTKVKVKQGLYTRDDSKAAPEKYNKINDFKQYNHVCQ